MKRSSNLESLSHDHYAGLQLAARIRRVCETGGEVLPLVADIQEFRINELRPHFAAETTLLLPLLQNIEPTYATRMVSEHEALNALVDKLSNDTAGRRDELCNFGALLAAHIRFEEREAFPAIEKGVDEDTLVTIKMRLDALK